MSPFESTSDSCPQKDGLALFEPRGGEQRSSIRKSVDSSGEMIEAP